MSLVWVLSFYFIPPFLAMIIASYQRRSFKLFTQQTSDFACVITAYKNIEITTNLVKSLLEQHYDKFHIYLVADQCDFDTYPIDDSRLTVLKPATSLSSKVKAILYGYSHFVRKHDTVVVFDPDNLAVPDFLNEIDNYLRAGYIAVQGKRTAKNLDTVYACLDAAGEFYYNHTQRFVPFVLGSSATIAGSGMAIEATFYQDFLQHELELSKGEVIVAEDKMLQIHLVNNGKIIAYADKAIVFDEKVATGEQVTRQRKRWLNSFFLHYVQAIKLMFRGIVKLNWNQTFFGYIISIPPMFILGLSTCLMLFISVFVSLKAVGLAVLIVGMFIITYFGSLKAAGAPKAVFEALSKIHLFVFRQLSAMLGLKQSNKDFLVTEKTKNVGIEELLNNTNNH